MWQELNLERMEIFPFTNWNLISRKLLASCFNVEKDILYPDIMI